MMQLTGCHYRSCRMTEQPTPMRDIRDILDKLLELESEIRADPNRRQPTYNDMLDGALLGVEMARSRILGMLI